MDLPEAKPTSPNATQEADIGSGERSPGQRDTDALIDQIGKAPPPADPPPPADETAASTTQRQTGPI